MANIPLDIPAQLDLEKFVSEQTHDLRSPFNQIVGFSKMMLNSAGVDYPPEMQQEDLGTIYRSGQRALLLMNGLIDLALLNRHEKQAAPTELEIKAALEQSLAYWKKFNPASTLQTSYQVQTAQSTFFADELLVRQILAGFIMYVAQYVDPHAQVTLLVEEEPQWFVLTVTGAGTKAQPLSQLDLAMQGYIGRASIELQGGQIRRAEETAEGASIQFVLPRAVANP